MTLYCPLHITRKCQCRTDVGANERLKDGYMGLIGSLALPCIGMSIERDPIHTKQGVR